MEAPQCLGLFQDLGLLPRNLQSPEPAVLHEKLMESRQLPGFWSARTQHFLLELRQERIQNLQLHRNASVAPDSGPVNRKPHLPSLSIMVEQEPVHHAESVEPPSHFHILAAVFLDEIEAAFLDPG